MVLRISDLRDAVNAVMLAMHIVTSKEALYREYILRL